MEDKNMLSAGMFVGLFGFIIYIAMIVLFVILVLSVKRIADTHAENANINKEILKQLTDIAVEIRSRN
jgi:uncharacterized membrane protein